MIGSLVKDMAGNVYRRKMFCWINEETRIVVAYSDSELIDKVGPIKPK